MGTYFLLMSSPVGRIIRLLTGIILVIGGILGSHYSSLVWLLIVPGMGGIVVALLDLNLLAMFFGLPLIGSDLRNRIHKDRGRETGLGRLTFVKDSLQHSSDLHRRQ